MLSGGKKKDIMRRIFFPEEFTPDSHAVIKGQDAFHICKVLRMKQGSCLELFNGKGTTYKGVIQTASAKEVVVLISEKHIVTSHPPPKIALCQGIIKGNRFGWLIEKATELGVDAIIPIITSRTEIHLHDKMSEKVERWRRIAVSAAEQSRKDTIPEITQPQLYSNIINKIASLSSSCRSIFLWENEKDVTLKQLLPKTPPEELWCIIGPEGGFSEEEVALAKNSGIPTASLGSLTLRADTAPIAALAILRHTYPW